MYFISKGFLHDIFLFPICEVSLKDVGRLWFSKTSCHLYLLVKYFISLSLLILVLLNVYTSSLDKLFSASHCSQHFLTWSPTWHVCGAQTTKREMLLRTSWDNRLCRFISGRRILWFSTISCHLYLLVNIFFTISPNLYFVILLHKFIRYVILRFSPFHLLSTCPGIWPPTWRACTNLCRNECHSKKRNAAKDREEEKIVVWPLSKFKDNSSVWNTKLFFSGTDCGTLYNLHYCLLLV